MADALCKYRGLAPWILAAVTIIIQVVALSYSYGQIAQGQEDDRRRIQALEASDHDQMRQLSEAASRLARIESGVDYIRDAVRVTKVQ